MYCSKCGTELPEGAAACPNCGEHINKGVDLKETTKAAYEKANGLVDSLFFDSSKRIKKLAKVLFVVASIICVIAGVVVLFSSFRWYSWSFKVGFLQTLGGLLIGAGGVFVAWLSCLMIYGYGELIENTKK